jgi:hypothetical protein
MPCIVARSCRRADTAPGLLPGAAHQIRFILLQNRQGRTRLAKYYVPLDDGEKRKLETDIHRLVVNRDPKATNFVEVRCSALHPFAHHAPPDSLAPLSSGRTR